VHQSVNRDFDSIKMHCKKTKTKTGHLLTEKPDKEKSYGRPGHS